MGLEPTIPDLGDRCLIHKATGAYVNKNITCLGTIIALKNEYIKKFYTYLQWF